MNKYIRALGALLISGYFINYLFTFTNWHFIDNVNLIFHEAGHTIFIFFGDYTRAAAGSGLQIALPFLIFLYFFFTHQKISSALCLQWTGQNLINVSLYAGDAIKMQLPLLGGDNVIHDWNYLLSTAGILKYTNTIATFLFWIGFSFIILGIISAIYFSYNLKEKDVV